MVASFITGRSASSLAITAFCQKPAAPIGPKPKARSSGRSATSVKTSSWAARSTISMISTGAQKHDLGAPDVLLRRVAILADPLETLSVRGTQVDDYTTAHPR